MAAGSDYTGLFVVSNYTHRSVEQDCRRHFIMAICKVDLTFKMKKYNTKVYTFPSTSNFLEVQLQIWLYVLEGQ